MPLLTIDQRATAGATPSDSVTLGYDERKKSRLRTQSVSGVEFAIVLPRGSTLRDGDLLQGEGGVVLRVDAAPEDVSEAHTRDPLLLARAAYHLGNRHVALQIGEAAVSGHATHHFVRYQHDHVLDDMLRELGLDVTRQRAAFQPEGGAYAHGHAHADLERPIFRRAR